MRNRRSRLAVLVLLGATWCTGGCVDGVRFGLQGGVEDAIAAAVETIITNALNPIVNHGGEAE